MYEKKKIMEGSKLCSRLDKQTIAECASELQVNLLEPKTYSTYH